jgi:hypothetical protein
MASLMSRANNGAMDPDWLEDYADVLQEIAINEEEFEACRRYLLKTESWFPSPACWVSAIIKARQIRDKDLVLHRLANMVLALDEGGVERLAYRGDVHDGRIIPERKRASLPPGFIPNGLPHVAPRALPSHVDTMSDRALILFANTSKDPEAFDELRKRAGLKKSP